MSVERPTFHESWNRVANLRPRLRSTTQITRANFRGEHWRIVQDSTGARFFRLNNSAYRFVGLLDGNRTVVEAWRLVNDQLGDDAPTQGEVIQLLGQLHTSNLLHADISPDTAAVFRRQRKRTQRELTQRLTNFFYVRIPLVDPNRFLDRWAWLVGWLFTPVGLALWCILLLVGAFHLIGAGQGLIEGAESALAPRNLWLLYVSYAVIKGVHELGHAFACKVFGKRDGDSGGEVHALGIMLLFFMPVPYADASNAWTLRSKWQRIVVGGAGIIVELAIASVAAVIWTRTASDSTLHALAYNAILIAGVSTLFFNGNPLLRYDGYFILSDLLEVPNLAQRSKEQLYYLVKKHIWRAPRLRESAHTPGERIWLPIYAVVSGVYRIFVSVAILFMLATRFLFVGAALAALSIVLWLIIPASKFFHYLATHSEIQRVRTRAVSSTLAFAIIILAAITLIPAPDRAKAEGVVEPARLAVIHAEVPGVLEEMEPTGYIIDSDSSALLRLKDPSLLARVDELRAAVREVEHLRRRAITTDPARALALASRANVLREQLARAETDAASLAINAPFHGVWIAPSSSEIVGKHFARGEVVGIVADLDQLIIRAAATQQIAARLSQAGKSVEVRTAANPGQTIQGAILKIAPAGEDILPSAALGYLGGGAIAVDPNDSTGRRAAQRFFEIRISLPPNTNLLPGQRVTVRFDTPNKPLLAQWTRAIRQLLQRTS